MSSFTIQIYVQCIVVYKANQPLWKFSRGFWVYIIHSMSYFMCIYVCSSCSIWLFQLSISALFPCTILPKFDSLSHLIQSSDIPNPVWSTFSISLNTVAWKMATGFGRPNHRVVTVFGAGLILSYFPLRTLKRERNHVCSLYFSHIINYSSGYQRFICGSTLTWAT